MTTVFVAPGNAGTATEANLQNVAISPDDHDGLATFAQENNIALTIVGPEAPLVGGIVNHFSRLDLRCFGPTAQAAQLEARSHLLKTF